MADSIRLRAGLKAGMPRLADREPAFVRDEAALYIGTPEGNRMVAQAGLAERTAALERTAADHAAALAGLREDSDTLAAAQSALSERLGGCLERQSALEQTAAGHTDALTALDKAKLTAVPAAAQPPLPSEPTAAELSAAWAALLSALQAAGLMAR